LDTLSPKERSKRMSLVRSKNTKPELMVRRLVHGLGFRFRIHDPKMPGSPDIVFRSRKKVIFIHGCFWHGHACHLGRMPKSRVGFWSTKIAGNRKRDGKVSRAIRAMGWRKLVLWECRLKDQKKLEKIIKEFMDA
jgi:DNA mismatch endonuclease (patch repair protein)